MACGRQGWVRSRRRWLQGKGFATHPPLPVWAWKLCYHPLPTPIPSLAITAPDRSHFVLKREGLAELLSTLGWVCGGKNTGLLDSRTWQL